MLVTEQEDYYLYYYGFSQSREQGKRVRLYTSYITHTCTQCAEFYTKVQPSSLCPCPPPTPPPTRARVQPAKQNMRIT